MLDCPESIRGPSRTARNTAICNTTHSGIRGVVVVVVLFTVNEYTLSAELGHKIR